MVVLKLSNSALVPCKVKEMNVIQQEISENSHGIIRQSPPKANSELNWDRINIALNWNLSNIKRFMVTREHFKKEYVEVLAVEYSRYLGIIAAYPEDRFPVSEAVDAIWHTHILFTRDYARMSNQVRGEYINHDPVLYEKERLALEPYYFKGTLPRYKEIYGEYPPESFWSSKNGAICYSGYEIFPLEN